MGTADAAAAAAAGGGCDGSLFVVLFLFLWSVLFSEELYEANSWGMFQLRTADATADANTGAGGCGSIFGMKVTMVNLPARVLTRACVELLSGST